MGILADRLFGDREDTNISIHEENDELKKKIAEQEKTIHELAMMLNHALSSGVSKCDYCKQHSTNCNGKCPQPEDLIEWAKEAVKS